VQTQAKNIPENSRTMPHHISPLKNNSENLRKPPQPMSHFSIEKIIQKTL
jgi:hypothetical protein